MTAVSEIFDHTFTISDARVTSDGFGVGLIAVAHAFWSDRVRAFDQPDDMLASPYNVPASSALYKAAVAFMSQSPSPSSGFKVGKLMGPVAQSVELVPATPTAGMVYSLNVDGQPVSITADSTPTLAEVTAALTTAISALADVTAVDTTGVKVTVNADTATVRHSIEVTSGNMTVKEVTALGSPSVATDLAAIEVVDGDWYFLKLVNAGAASIKDAAAWCETQQKIFIADSGDSGIIDGNVSNDVLSDLATAGYNRTALMYHHKPDSQQPAAAWGGVMLPKLPGPATFANKGLAGVDVSPLDATARGVLDAKGGNYYIDIRGLGFTLHGAAVSGRWLDVTVALDWFDVSLAERIVLLLRNNDVVPYTAKGIELIAGQVEAQILEGGRLGIIDTDQPYAVTKPKLADVNPGDKLDRILAGLGYSYVLSGAVHKVKVKGNVQE